MDVAKVFFRLAREAIIFSERFYLDVLFLFPLGFFISSQVIIRLPFMPVPMSIQPLPIFVAAWFFGYRAVAGYCMYLLEGAMGFPIFAGFSGGIPHLLGPTGGFLMSFGLASLVVASWRLAITKLVHAYLLYWAVSLFFFACAVGYLSFFVGLKAAFFAGFVPFIPGDFIVKAMFFAAVTKLKKVV